jgi:cardiolipin synthase A/B
MTMLVSFAADLARSLPTRDVGKLADALRGGTPALRRLTADAAGVTLRAASRRLLGMSLSVPDAHLVAGVLLGSSSRSQPDVQIDAVWTGPDSGASVSRLTSSVVVELLDDARSEILLTGYAVHTEPVVAAALRRADYRDVAVTLLIERSADNPRFTGRGAAFPNVSATRWHWPPEQRPPGTSLHAKVLVIDRATALIGSANITSAALERNLECGVLVRGGPLPAQVHDHLHGLHRIGRLRTLDSGGA